MGIERFFNSLIKTENSLNNQVLIKHKPATKYLYIDFNSILYKIADDIEMELNKLLFEFIYDEKIHTSKNINVSKNWGYNESIPFSTYFTDKLIQDNIHARVKMNLEFIYENIIDSTNLEYIYIALDGIPNMAKIVEQKRRRYMGYIIGECKKYIEEKHFNSLGEKRKIYEKNKIKISRSKFFSSDEFMRNVSDKLKEYDFGVKKYIISGSDIPGEGEKKIMENLLGKKIDGPVSIYSPDSDMIILTSILSNMISKKTDIYVIRYDQQAKIFDVAYINAFTNNIVEYVRQHLELSGSKMNTYIPDNEDIINDVMFIFTMFGNDFVHRIESIDAKRDSDILMDMYLKTIVEEKKGIVYRDTLNLHAMTQFLKNISMHEPYLLCDTYLSKNYKNYKHLRSIFINYFWYGTLHLTLIVYFKIANIIFKHINSKNIGDIKNIKSQIEIILNTHNSDTSQHNFNDVLLIFMILESDMNMKEINGYSDIENIFIKRIKNTGNKLVPSVKFSHYDYDVNSKYHQERIKKYMPFSGMKITSMDKELYEFDFMLGKYREILNAGDDGVGKCILKYVNEQYVYMYDTYQTSKQKFYNTYLGCNERIDDLCKKYIEGIVWVFDFYYIKNDRKHNYENISTWFYGKHISPLLTDMYDYLKNIILDSKEFQESSNNTNIYLETQNYLSNMYVNRDKFFNDTYHYLYVTPKNIIITKDNMKKYVDSNLDIYPDLDKYVSLLMQGGDTKNIINCGRSTFIIKCIMVQVTYASFDEFVSRMRRSKIMYGLIKN